MKYMMKKIIVCCVVAAHGTAQLSAMEIRHRGPQAGNPYTTTAAQPDDAKHGSCPTCLHECIATCKQEWEEGCGRRKENCCILFGREVWKAAWVRQDARAERIERMTR